MPHEQHPHRQEAGQDRAALVQRVADTVGHRFNDPVKAWGTIERAFIAFLGDHFNQVLSLAMAGKSLPLSADERIDLALLAGAAEVALGKGTIRTTLANLTSRESMMTTKQARLFGELKRLSA